MNKYVNKYAVAAFIAFGALLGVSAQAAPVSPAFVQTQAASGDAALQKVWYRRYGYGYRHYGYRPRYGYGYRRYGYGYRHYGYRRHYGYGYRHYVTAATMVTVAGDAVGDALDAS